MEYPHQQYMQYRQQQQPQHPTSQQQQQRGPVYVRPYEAAGGDPRGTRPTQTLHVGTADNELPMTAPSGREAAVASLQALAQCGREEALYYLAEHNYDVHRAMAARTADVRWELQRGCALPRPAPEQPQIPQETVVQVGPSLQAQLEEARQRLRTRYERETGDTSSSPGALALPLQQPQPTLATAPPAAQPPAAQAAASAPPLVYFPSPAAGAPPQYAAPHLPAQQAQPYTPTTHLPPPAQTSAPSYHYPQQLQQQQPVLYPPPAPTTYAPLQQPGHGWEEASREEANINAGTTRRENPLTLAGQTLGKWIWGGTHHKDKSGSSSSSASSSTPTSASASSSSTTMAPPAPLQSSVSSSAFYPTTSTVPVGEERPGLGMGRRYQSDDSLEINELARDRRSCNGRRAEGTARDEEASTEEGESRGGLRHLLSSVRHRGREIVDRIGHHQATPSGGGGEPQQLTPASEEEELESRRGHRRRSSHSGGGSSAGKRDKRASLDEGWVLVDNTSTRSSTSTHPPQPTLVTQVPLTDEQYAARLSRQLAEEEERQRRRDEELARRIQRQEEEEVRRRAREAEQEAEQRDNTRSSGRSRRRSHGPVHVVVSRGPFGEVLVSEGLSPSTLYIDEPRGRRRRTGGLVGLLEMMREMHEMSLAQNMSQESGYPFVLAPNASTSSRRQDMTYEQLLGLAERVGNVNRGVSHAAMDALPTRTFQEKDKKADQEDNKCTICLCDYEEGDTLRALPCLHSYHKDCIDHWLKSHNTCPVCKTQINM